MLWQDSEAGSLDVGIVGQLAANRIVNPIVVRVSLRQNQHRHNEAENQEQAD